MPAWDNVALPGAPAPPSYAAPLVDFANIGNLGNSYFKGQEQSRQLAMMNAFPQGIPKDAQGNPDINAIANVMAKLGGVQGATQAIPLVQGQQLIDQYSRGMGAPSTDTETQTQRQPVSVPPHGIPQPQLSSAGTDNQGQDTVQTLASELSGNRELPAGMIPNFAKALGVDPLQPLTPDQVARAKQIMGPSISRVAQAPQQQTTPARPVEPTTLPPGVSEAEANKARAEARYYANRANLAERIRAGMGAGDLALSKQAAEREAEIRKQLAARGPEALEFEASKDVLKSKIARSAKTYEGINAQATQYEADMKPYVTLSKSLLNDPDMYSGIGGQWSLDINRVRAAFGDAKAAQLQEALQKVTANTVLGNINQQRNEMMEAGGQSSRIFSQQVGLVEKAAPQLATTLGGNRFLVQVASKIGELAQKRAELARDYLDPTKGNHKFLDEGFDAKLSKWMRDNPLFSKEELANPALIGAPQVPDDIAREPTRITVWAGKMHLRPGDAFRTHDGRYMQIPGKAPAQPNSAQAGQQM